MVVALTATDAVVLGPNPRREALVLSPARQSRYSIAFGEPAVLDTGITVHPGQLPVLVTREKIGEDIGGEVHVIAEAVDDRRQVLTVANAVATDSLGSKISYTTPAGFGARLRFASRFDNAGLPTTQIQVTSGADNLIIVSDAAAFQRVLDISLPAAASVDIVVTVVAVAASTSDFTLSVEEFRLAAAGNAGWLTVTTP